MNEQIKAGPKDVFLHLLAITALYVGAGGFIALIFDYINLTFPDVLTMGVYYDPSYIYSSIRWEIALLVVVFPVYVFVSWFLNKDYATDPAKRNLKIRKWLIYFTLFLAAIILIGDLVTLIFNFLGGDLTARFIFKILTVFLVTGGIFWYYFWDLKKYKTE